MFCWVGGCWDSDSQVSNVLKRLLLGDVELVAFVDDKKMSKVK